MCKPNKAIHGPLVPLAAAPGCSGAWPRELASLLKSASLCVYSNPPQSWTPSSFQPHTCKLSFAFAGTCRRRLIPRKHCAEGSKPWPRCPGAAWHKGLQAQAQAPAAGEGSDCIPGAGG